MKKKYFDYLLRTVKIILRNCSTYQSFVTKKQMFRVVRNLGSAFNFQKKKKRFIKDQQRFQINWFNCCRFHMRLEVESQHDILLPHPISLGILAIGIDLGLVHLDILSGGFHLWIHYLYYPSLQQPWFLGRLKPGGNHSFWQAIQNLKLILKSIINLKIQKTCINLFFNIF